MNCNHIYRSAGLPLLAVAVLALILAGGCHHEDNARRLMEMEEECARLTRNKTDFARSDSLARIMLAHGRENGDYLTEAKALYYLGVYDGGHDGVEERHRNLEKCLSLLDPQRDDSLMLKVYNALGIYEVAYYRRFSLAAHYFTQSMNMARALDDEPKAIVAEQNLSAIMITTGDTLGIGYDRDIYRYAKENGDSALLASSASHCGIYYSQHKFDEEKARFFAGEVKGTPLDVNYHKIMAYIAMHKGQLEEAQREMRTVLEMSPDDPTAAMNYAALLNEMNDPVQSNRYVDRADSLFSQIGIFGLEPESARLRADNHARLGNMAEAYRWEKIYAGRLDSLQLLKQKEAVATSRIKFETQKKEHTIAMQRASMHNLYTWIFFICLIFVVSAISVVSYLRRRNRRYRLTAERMRMAVAQEKALRDMLNARERELEECRASAVNTPSPAAADPLARSPDRRPAAGKAGRYEAGTIERIFKDILREVVDKQGYRDPTITRDVLSERVGCNHTYLSETIKSKTGMSYSRYLNSVRVNEAVRMLTDGTQMSLEELSRYVGFLSIKTFYVAFKEFVGVPPGNFRSIISEKS